MISLVANAAQMCKLMRVKPGEVRGASDSARLSELRVIHKPRLLSQRGTEEGGRGREGRRDRCQHRRLRLPDHSVGRLREDLPDTGPLSVSHTLSALSHNARTRRRAFPRNGDRMHSVS